MRRNEKRLFLLTFVFDSDIINYRIMEKKEPDLNKKLKELEKQKQEYLAGWQRARADFLNYKKQDTERKKEFVKYAKEDFGLQVLSILDNIYIAEKKIPKELKESHWMQGFLKIKKQFENFLKEQGIEEIKSLGEEFNPKFHQAAEQVETNKESGIIVDVVRKGYMMNDRVIRAARVKISK